jgi:LSD1 subclass zinc finger protein
MQRLKVTVSCPSCGAPFQLLEGANVARCSYCDLPLLIRSQKNILRYYLEPKLKERSISFLVDRYKKESRQSLPKRIDETRLFFLPFWRFNAQAFYAVNKQPDFLSSPLHPDEKEETEEIRTKDWDINFTAHMTNNLGISTLGMRPDWLNLKLLTEKTYMEEKGEILQLEIDSGSAKRRALKSLEFYLERKKSPEDELILRLVEEHLSLIYFPLWLVNFITSQGKFHLVIDGITKRTLKEDSGYFDLRDKKGDEVEKFHPLKMVPHRCPNCGWDLPVASFHVVFPCGNCKRIWQIHQGTYRQITGEIARAKEEPQIASSESLICHPLWVFEMRLQKEESSSIERIFKVLPSEVGLFGIKDKSTLFLFYIPAFEMKNLYKIPDVGLAFIRTQPDLETDSPKGEKLKGVFISEDDAKKIAELLWLNLISRKANLDLNDLKNPTFKNGRIIWCPFYRDGTFLQDAIIGYCFQKVG